MQVKRTIGSGKVIVSQGSEIVPEIVLVVGRAANGGQIRGIWLEQKLAIAGGIGIIRSFLLKIDQNHQQSIVGSPFTPIHAVGLLVQQPGIGMFAGQ